MNRRNLLPALGVLMCCLANLTLRAAEAQVAYVDDPAAMLPQDPPAAATLAQHLAAFESSSEVRILVRFHAHSPSAEEDAKPGVYMRALAGNLGVAEGGVLAVYFADEDDWRMWIGDNLTAKFAGQPGTAAELTANGAIHDAKEKFFETTTVAARAVLAVMQKSAPPDAPLTPAHRIHVQAETIVSELMDRFRVSH